MRSWDRRRFLVETGKGLCVAAAAGQLGGVMAGAQPVGKTGGSFPKDFLWGASTAAMQVEGYPLADGGGKSIWDDYELKPGIVKDGSTNQVADDEYHRWAEDIGHMKEIGLNAYRLSIGWPRVLPEGRGAANEKGLAYYDKVIDGLLEAGITPLVTVYHFDLPEALGKRGGWLNEDSSHWLAEYAELVTKRYSDRVSHWLTINEPNILWGFGAEAGTMPPALHLDDAQLVKGAHNLLLGHGRSVQAMRAAAKKPIKVGLAFAGMLSLPATESKADVEAARADSFAVRRRKIIPNQPGMGMMNNAWWLDPIYLGKYPEDGLKMFPSAEKLAASADMQVIHQRVDYCPVNLYFAPTVKAGADGRPEEVPDGPETKRTHYGWAITPSLLYWGPKFLAERYRKPVVITENGMSWADRPGADGKIHDVERIEFLNGYLGAFKRAHAEGVPLLGYFHWSLIDNWEFTSGYTEQFGLIYVDRATQKRTVKDSAARYREIIRSSGAVL